MKILWVLVGCNTTKEARSIGKNALNGRLIACFDVFHRTETRYFWPPKSGKITKGRGCLLVMETLKSRFNKVKTLTLKIYSDKLPFIGSITVGNIDMIYMKWMKMELKDRFT